MNADIGRLILDCSPRAPEEILAAGHMNEVGGRLAVDEVDAASSVRPAVVVVQLADVVGHAGDVTLSTGLEDRVRRGPPQRGRLPPPLRVETIWCFDRPLEEEAVGEEIDPIYAGRTFTRQLKTRAAGKRHREVHVQAVSGRDDYVL